jgi:aminoglycoside phosphotransferase (APT) family kinase protein
LNAIKPTPESKEKTTAVMAEMTAYMHKIKNHQFGYIQTGLQDNWYKAIRAMTVALLKDTRAAGRRSLKGERLLKAIDHHQHILVSVEGCMVNFDMWPSNIIYNPAIEQYAWIDPERSFWGDPIADFVCLEITMPLEKKNASLKAYNAIADVPIKITDEIKIRYAIAQGYLGLMMETEKYFRYSPLYFGWWRNVLVSGMLYKQALKV